MMGGRGAEIEIEIRIEERYRRGGPACIDRIEKLASY